VGRSALGNVRFGSKASFLAPSGDVRFYPQSDRLLQRREVTLCAISDHSAVQTKALFSGAKCHRPVGRRH